MNVTLQEASKRLSAAGVRRTKQRELILHYLYGERALSHPSAEQLFAAVNADYPKLLSLPTVYKNIRALRQLGLLQEFYIGQSNTARYDTLLQPHHHLHCTSCGAIADYRTAALPQEAPSGFSVDRIYMEISGTCENCRAKRGSGLAIAI